tara:strand:- start:32039 stop:33418 length:1380 start_codon:yes stop_codon:yes gene_type:complete
MFPHQYITGISTPKITYEQGDDTLYMSAHMNGINEFIDVYNPELVKIDNDEGFMVDGYDVSDGWWQHNHPSLDTAFHWRYFWYKPTALSNANEDDKVIFHNGLSGNDAFKIYIADGETDLKIFLGAGGATNKEWVVTGAGELNVWHYIALWVQPMTTSYPGEVSMSIYHHRDRVHGPFTNADGTSSFVTDHYTANNTDDHITIGAYRVGVNGTPGNFFVGEISDCVCVARQYYMRSNADKGQSYDWSTASNGHYSDTSAGGSARLILCLQMGDFTAGGSRRHGAQDGDDNLVLFDASKRKHDDRTDRAGGKLVFGNHTSGDWTLSNGTWAVSSSILQRTGGTSTSSATAQFDGFTPVVGRLYKVEWSYTVSTACGDVADTLTFAGTTLSSSTTVAIHKGIKWVKASNTNKLVLTAASDSDSRTTMNLGTIYIWEYDRYGIMVNMTKTSNLKKTGPRTFK